MAYQLVHKQDIAAAICCAIQVHFLPKKLQVYPIIKLLSTASRCGRDKEVREKQTSLPTFSIYWSYYAACFNWLHQVKSYEIKVST